MPHKLQNHPIVCISIRTAICAAVSLAMIGCGGEPFPRHQISGKVTFQGQGVEYGTIIFEPDASIGKLAPTSRARIENGEFQTAAKESPTAGKYKVRVMGFDKSRMKTDVEPGEIVETPELFPEHVLNVDVPPPNGRLDIDVPARGTAALNGSRE